MTNDQVGDGGSWREVGALKLLYRSVIQSGYAETVVARLREDGNSSSSLWKYSRYFDGKSAKQPDEHELYCLSDDPLEQHNLAQTAKTTTRSALARARLEELLGRCRAEKRLT